jgi:hypothetical protein
LVLSSKAAASRDIHIIAGIEPKEATPLLSQGPAATHTEYQSQGILHDFE